MSSIRAGRHRGRKALCDKSKHTSFFKALDWRSVSMIVALWEKEILMIDLSLQVMPTNFKITCRWWPWGQGRFLHRWCVRERHRQECRWRWSQRGHQSEDPSPCRRAWGQQEPSCWLMVRDRTFRRTTSKWWMQPWSVCKEATTYYHQQLNKCKRNFLFFSKKLGQAHVYIITYGQDCQRPSQPYLLVTTEKIKTLTEAHKTYIGIFYLAQSVPCCCLTAYYWTFIMSTYNISRIIWIEVYQYGFETHQVGWRANVIAASSQGTLSLDGLGEHGLRGDQSFLVTRKRKAMWSYLMSFIEWSCRIYLWSLELR